MKQHIVIDARVRRSSTGRYADQLVEHLQNIDHTNRYTILVQPGDDWHMRAGNFTTVPCPFPQFSFNPLHELRFAWQLYRLRPDLVHFTMTQQPLLYFGNIVTTTHDLIMFQFVRRGSTPVPVYRLKMRLYRFLIWWSHRKSTRIIVPTKTIAKEVAAFQPSTSNKLAVTYEDVGVPPKTKAEPVPGISGRFIMYMGNGFPHKNVSGLVAAFDILHKKYPDLTLLLGGKREKNYIAVEEEAQSHPSISKIIFTGFLPDAQAKWAFQHCEAFVLPSFMEGFGIPALEAMAQGAPVVSSGTSVMPEVYGDAALYFDPADPEDIATKISEVLDNPQLRQKLKDAGKQQLKKYSWDKMARETLTVYKDILG